MSRMLPFAAAAEVAIRAQLASGHVSALRGLRRLVRRADLAPERAIALHRLAASVCSQHHRLSPARRHLRAAVRIDWADPESYFRWGQIEFAHDDGNRLRAVRCFVRAVKLMPTNARYWAILSRAAALTGKDRLARRALRKALTLAPSNLNVLLTLAEACRTLGTIKPIWKAVCKARFLMPADAGLKSLWERLRYDYAEARQRRTTGQRSTRVLPFLRLVRDSGESVRVDVHATHSPHLRRVR